MNHPNGSFGKFSGSVLIIALIVIVVSTTILIGWAQLIASRQAFAQASDLGNDRRIALQNARVLSRQYILTNMDDGIVPLTNFAVGISQFSIASDILDAYRFTNSFFYNAFSPMGRDSFSLDRLVTLTTVIGTNTTQETWRAYLRSWSPLDGGFPLVLQSGASTVNLTLPNSYITYANGTNGTQIQGLFSGFPQVPMSSGSGFVGLFNQTAQLSAATIASTNFSGYTNATANDVQLFINPPQSTDAVVSYTVPLNITSTTSRRFTNNVGSPVYTTRTHRIRSIRLIGSSATNMLQINIPSANTNLATIFLQGQNSRPIYITRSGTAAEMALTIRTDTTFSGGDWVLSVAARGTPINLINDNGPLRILGGIRTDRRITRSGTGDVTLATGPFFPPFSTLVDRILWLETTRTP